MIKYAYQCMYSISLRLYTYTNMAETISNDLDIRPCFKVKSGTSALLSANNKTKLKELKANILVPIRSKDLKMIPYN